MGAPPTPVRATASGLVTVLSLITTAALRNPVALGVKVTAMLQLAPELNVAVVLPLGMHEFVCVKSPLSCPVMPIPLRLSGALPTLLSVVL